MLGTLPIIIIFLSSKEGDVAEKDDGRDTRHSNGIDKAECFPEGCDRRRQNGCDNSFEKVSLWDAYAPC